MLSSWLEITWFKSTRKQATNTPWVCSFTTQMEDWNKECPNSFNTSPDNLTTSPKQVSSALRVDGWYRICFQAQITPSSKLKAIHLILTMESEEDRFHGEESEYLAHFDRWSEIRSEGRFLSDWELLEQDEKRSARDFGQYEEWNEKRSYLHEGTTQHELSGGMAGLLPNFHSAGCRNRVCAGAEKLLREEEHPVSNKNWLK